MTQTLSALTALVTALTALLGIGVACFQVCRGWDVKDEGQEPQIKVNPAAAGTPKPGVPLPSKTTG